MEFGFCPSAVGSHWRVQHELVSTVRRSRWLLHGEQIGTDTGRRDSSWKAVWTASRQVMVTWTRQCREVMDLGHSLEVTGDWVVVRQTFTFPSAIGRMSFLTPLFWAWPHDVLRRTDCGEPPEYRLRRGFGRPCMCLPAFLCFCRLP